MRIVRLVFALALAFAAVPAVAWDVLYRGDSREPEIIFRVGFAPLGSNRNVLGHISGESCWLGSGETRSAYVAMTEIEQDARQYGAGVYAQRAYVYRIVPDADAPDGFATFDALPGLLDMEARRDALGLHLRLLVPIQRLTHFHATQGQHLSQRVPADWVQSVDIYERNFDTGALVFLRNEVNPRFVRPLHVGSRDVFTPTMVAALAPIDMLYLGGSDNATTLCMASGCSSPQRSQTANDDDRCLVEPAFQPGNLFDQVVDIILD